MYKIENVALDPNSPGRHKPGVEHYPLIHLSVGQSFLVPAAESKQLKLAIKHRNNRDGHLRSKIKWVDLGNGFFRVGRVLR